jgi:hypothetical protein
VSSVVVMPIGATDGLGREVFVLSLPAVTSTPFLKLSSPQFACLVACDSTALDGPQLVALGRWLINQGASYVCAWGPGCQDMEDAVDQAAVEIEMENGAERPVVMTTSHPDDSLEEALEFLSRCAWPDEDYLSKTASTVAIAIGNAAWAQEMRSWLTAHRF